MSPSFIVFWIIFMAIAVGHSHACPLSCTCKWKNGKKTADCSNQTGGISLPAGGIDEDTQVFEFNYNNLQALVRDMFVKMNLPNLQKLHIKNNSLGYVSEGAFRTMINLIEIDLTGNMLTHIPSLAFSDVPYLRTLVLAQNPIQKLEPFAFPNLTNLIKLDLSSNQIYSLASETFSGLEGLETLKLHNNKLTELPDNSIDVLRHIKTLELHDNPWQCDCSMRTCYLWMKRLSIYLSHSMTCNSPERLANKSVLDLHVDDFACLPIIKMEPSKRYVETVSGSNATFECSVASNPVARITWHRNGQAVTNTTSGEKKFYRIYEYGEDSVKDKKSKLVVNVVEEIDAGQYHCEAANPAGTDSANFTLTVSPPLSGIMVSIAMADTYQSIYIICALVLCIMFVTIALLVWKIRKENKSGEESDNSACNGNPKETYSHDDAVSQQSHDSVIKSPPTYVSDYSPYAQGLYNNGVDHSACATPVSPSSRPISDYCHNWQRSYVLPRAASASGFSLDTNDRMPMIVDTVSAAGSGSDEVFTNSRLSCNDYPSDYGLPILPENSACMAAMGTPQLSAKTLKVWQRGVPVYPPNAYQQQPRHQSYQEIQQPPIPQYPHPHLLHPQQHQYQQQQHPQHYLHQQHTDMSHSAAMTAVPRRGCGTDV